MKCNKCKSEVEPHAIFCIYCGNDVSIVRNIVKRKIRKKTKGDYIELLLAIPLMMITVYWVFLNLWNWETLIFIIDFFIGFLAVFIAKWLMRKLNPNWEFCKNGYTLCLGCVILLCGIWIGHHVVEALTGRYWPTPWQLLFMKKIE